ncbi:MULTISPECIES: YrrS family protein [Cytobacillus]|uniref:DNA primase n=3 Tax=Cytobacillus TaxID=2675230 RepID=A0A160MEK9_9BACI|nr:MULTISPECIES: YrrS family protein [Cytobacillus]MCS0823604.1 YrrS family protein [Cytobacillus firmus]AND41597.1 DNA primase [Cytobacillus oceanisediminis 2691]MBU8730332.1 YrrS family protein [Cytobacillus oceanisediminis]MBU8770278.1 YrrS family protein [Cytobacillus oceanisediminis]MCM3242343.1 YrrS family protein [Cytobacillus oceanisediminis]
MKGNSRESRFGKREKRKKTNIILNSLIAFVIVLIIVVSAKIFLGGNNDQAVPADEQTASESKQNESSQEDQDNDIEQDKSKDKEKADKESDKEEKEAEENEAEDESEEDKEQVVTEGGSGPDVEKTIENPAWKPVGTSQSGEHTAVYDQNHVDWQEMLSAISYATGIEQGNMTVWFLGNNGPNSSVGTISTKDQSEKYRVYIDWVDGEGWKPSKVEVLNAIN